MPDWLSADARQLWDSVVPALAQRGVATLVDTAELSALCDWWGRWRAACREMNEINDLQSKEYYRLQILASNAWKSFSHAAAKFGLNPSDRARLRLDPGTKPEDELRAFAEQRGD